MKTRNAGDIVGRGGRYKLVEEIGAGAVLEVWSARQCLDMGNRTVALKFLKDSSNIAHLQSEIDLLQKVGQHPHIVNLYYRELENDPFIEVDLCHATLNEILGPDGLPFDDPVKKQEVAVKKIRNLANAVQFVHNKTSDSIIDLDPTNIMLQQYDSDKRETAVQLLEGTVKICDLNAKINQVSVRDSLVASLSTSISTGEKGSTHVFAKPYFIAPELLNSDAEPTFAADVYSLGKILSVMLTGRKELNPRYMPSKMGIAPAYDEVLATAVEPKIEERFQDIGQFLEAVEAAEKRPVRVTVSSWEWVKSGFSYKKAQAKKEKEAEAKWREDVQGIVDTARRKIEDAERDKRWEADRDRSIKREQEKKKKQQEAEEARRKEVEALEILLKERPDESRAAWLRDDSDIVIYQVNKVHDSTYTPTILNVPSIERREFHIQWMAWVNGGKHLAYCANFRQKNNPYSEYSAIGLINTDTFEIIEESLEYVLKTHNIHADAEEPIIYAANTEGKLIKFDLFNPEEEGRAKFVPIRGLRVCEQTNSRCGRFTLQKNIKIESHAYNEPRSQYAAIVSKEKPDIGFVIGKPSKIAVWYDPEKKTEESTEPESAV